MTVETPRLLTVITGASEGIGLELARVFARNGHDLALVARRRDRLEALADEIQAAGHTRPLVIDLDLAQKDAPQKLAEALSGAQVQYLVNNAGFGLIGAFAALNGEDQLRMIEVNISALTALSHLFLPQLIAARGGLLNVASIAAYCPGPGMAVYYATKAYVLSLTEAIWQETRASGLRVSALCPGPVPTGFQAAAGIKMRSAQPEAYMMSAADTAEAAYRGLMRGDRVILPGLATKIFAAVFRFMPRRPLLSLLAKQQLSRRKPAPASDSLTKG